MCSIVSRPTSMSIFFSITLRPSNSPSRSTRQSPGRVGGLCAKELRSEWSGVGKESPNELTLLTRGETRRIERPCPPHVTARSDRVSDVENDHCNSFRFVPSRSSGQSFLSPARQTGLPINGLRYGGIDDQSERGNYAATLNVIPPETPADLLRPPDPSNRTRLRDIHRTTCVVCPMAIMYVGVNRIGLG